MQIQTAVGSNIARRCIAVICIFLLAGCALLQKKEITKETYELSAPSSVSGLGNGTNAQILVKLPTALKSVDSDRIIVRPSPSVITYLAGAQWSDTVPRMVQAKLVETFENAAATRATAKPGDGLVIDFQLVSDIRRFEVLNGVATIEVSIKLLSDKSGLVQNTRIFTAQRTVAGETSDTVVASFNAAFDELSRGIVQWVVRET